MAITNMSKVTSWMHAYIHALKFLMKLMTHSDWSDVSPQNKSTGRAVCFFLYAFFLVCFFFWVCFFLTFTTSSNLQSRKKNCFKRLLVVIFTTLPSHQRWHTLIFSVIKIISQDTHRDVRDFILLKTPGTISLMRLSLQHNLHHQAYGKYKTGFRGQTYLSRRLVHSVALQELLSSHTVPFCLKNVHSPQTATTCTPKSSVMAVLLQMHNLSLSQYARALNLESSRHILMVW